MDLDQRLMGLRRELDSVNAAIAALEKVRGRETASPKSNRGRKSMGHEERVAVSDRMKKYWGGRRSGAEQPSTEATDSIGSRLSTIDGSDTPSETAQ